MARPSSRRGTQCLRATNSEGRPCLKTIPGIGGLSATALVAVMAMARALRVDETWLPGLLPGRVTTGSKPRLVGISKRGNKYPRKLLIHGARAALPTLLESPTPLGGWLSGEKHKNAAVVALANSRHASLALCCRAVRPSVSRFDDGVTQSLIRSLRAVESAVS
jgi:transposase